MFFTEGEGLKPLLGMGWLREFSWTIRHIKKKTTITDQSEKDIIFTNFEKLFKANWTIKDIEKKIPLKPKHSRIKQRAKPIPFQLQSYVEKGISNQIDPDNYRKYKKHTKTVTYLR